MKCGCGRTKKNWRLACDQCWALVPWALQQRVYHLYRTARGSEEHFEAVRECFEKIRAGRMTPKAGRMQS